MVVRHIKANNTYTHKKKTIRNLNLFFCHICFNFYCFFAKCMATMYELCGKDPLFFCIQLRKIEYGSAFVCRYFNLWFLQNCFSVASLYGLYENGLCHDEIMSSEVQNSFLVFFVSMKCEFDKVKFYDY